MSIQILPQEIVDRIAAGEVIQRPCNAIKELFENSLDAGATSITVTMESADSWSIVDNGSGIALEDLSLAATRHATSKLSTTSDFETLSSFGFRGEALASMSMCSHLTITSKPPTARVAYQQTYHDGAPSNEAPRPCARPQGTTVRMDNLFYNLPHRRKANSSSDAYNQVLSVLQSYAILVARNGVAVICQKKMRGQTKMDLNSTAAVRPCANATDMITKEHQAMATKHVLQQVYGSQIMPHLCEFESELQPNDDAADATAEVRTSRCSYTCHGFVTSPSYIQSNKSTLLLFCNQRLVECGPLKRAMEAVYAEYSTVKPVVYWSIQVPPHQVDVNVHPTKRQVTLLHLETITSHLQQSLRDFLQSQGQSFESQSAGQTKRKRDKENDASNTVPVQTQLTYTQSRLLQSATMNTKLPASKLIRTSRSSQSGSIEPFVLAQSQTQAQSRLSTEMTPSPAEPTSWQPSPAERMATPAPSSQHLPGCPLLIDANTADLSEPGAFAKLAAQCNCRTSAPVLLPATQPTQPPLRKIQPSDCQLKSIVSLRRTITDQAADASMVSQLRSSCLVGVVSQTRCLLQCGADLVLLNYYDCACELFYQLALMQFGALSVGKLAVPVDVVQVIGQFVELEDRLLLEDENQRDLSNSLLEVSETNRSVALQAATFLIEKADMLRDYFSITVHTDESGTICLTGLPALLPGHAPSPHGLALFLLRLATEVNYTKEKRCFQGICRELGLFYANVAASDESNWHSLLRHCLFPAISSLLVPSAVVQANSFKTVGNLSQLYRVFERC